MSKQPLPLDSAEVDARADRRQRDIGTAFANALKLGASLVATWGIALVTRLFIPRYLGPERFGILNFSDAFAGTAFVFMGLGIDQYVRKEISVRPAHTSDFIGGIIALRLILLAVVYAGMEVVLSSTHRDSQVRTLVYIMGIAQYFSVGSGTSAGLLQAAGHVNGISVLSVLIKFAWGGCILSAIYFRLELWAFATSLALTEGLRSIALFALARKHLQFQMKIDVRATLAVVAAAFPFCISGLASTVYDKIGTNVLGFTASSREVGWLGAAAGLHGITLMVAPLVSWILTPLFARAAADSRDELFRLIRRSLEFIIAIATPLTLFMALGANIWVGILFGEAFRPAANILRVMAISTLLMYLSIVAASALAVLNYTWRMSVVFLGALLVSAASNYVLIRHFASAGPGAEGAASAAAMTLTELAIVVPLVAMLGRQAIDRRLISSTGKNLVAAAIVVALDHFVRGAFGWWTLVLDGFAYLALSVGSGGSDIKGMIQVVKASRTSRSKEA